MRRASPTGYPFKVVRWTGSNAARASRTRRCDLGYLRTPCRLASGSPSHTVQESLTAEMPNDAYTPFRNESYGPDEGDLHRALDDIEAVTREPA